MHSRTVQLSFSGLPARICPDGFSASGHILEIGGAEQSHVDLADPTLIFYEYLRRIGHVVDLVGAPGEPITAAHLGAGALTLARYIQATRPGSDQVAVDIERELPTLVTDHLPLPAGTRLQVIIDDARAAVPQLALALGGRAPQVIILDIFSGWDAPEHLRQPSFYRELREALADDGLLAVNVGDDPGLSFFRAQARAMLGAFEHVWCLADSSMLTGKYPGNLILVGSSIALDDTTRQRLQAAGPHPASVLDSFELTEWLGATSSGD